MIGIIYTGEKESELKGQINALKNSGFSPKGIRLFVEDEVRQEFIKTISPVSVNSSNQPIYGGRYNDIEITNITREKNNVRDISLQEIACLFGIKPSQIRIKE